MRHEPSLPAAGLATVAVLILLILGGFALHCDPSIAHASQNRPLPTVDRIPSGDLLVFYYCPDCPLAEKQFVADMASIIVHQDPTTFERLHEACPHATNAVNLRYRIPQYLQYVRISDCAPNPQGRYDLALLAEFCAEQDPPCDPEDAFLHWSEPTSTSFLGASTLYDGEVTTVTCVNGAQVTIPGVRATAIVWGDVYMVFDWHADVWRDYIIWRTEREIVLPIVGRHAFDGLFEDVLAGPISDVFQGIGIGGGLREFNGATPREIAMWEGGQILIAEMQAELDAEFPGKVFLPNAGNYLADLGALGVIRAGDGTITESVNFPGSTWWYESWRVAGELARDRQYFHLSSRFDSSPEQQLAAAAWYWLAWVPGYVLFDVTGHEGCACCCYEEAFPKIMLADIGDPVGTGALVDSGELADGWHWELWGRPYDGGMVLFRGNAAWRGPNAAAPSCDDAAESRTTCDSGHTEWLAADGSGWVAGPDRFTHREHWGGVYRCLAGEADHSGEGSPVTCGF